jgi:sec-independent protein translocase protein TatB
LFGLSWDQIILILLAALFLLGPERIPTAIKWAMDSLRKVRTFAAGAQSEMRSQLGPELDELRRQIAELQSLKEIKELKELRDLDPRRMVGKSILGDEFSGGIKGFLGLTGSGPDSAAEASSGMSAAGGDGAAAAAASAVPQATPTAVQPIPQAQATTEDPVSTPAVTHGAAAERAAADSAAAGSTASAPGSWSDVT